MHLQFVLVSIQFVLVEQYNIKVLWKSNYFWINCGIPLELKIWSNANVKTSNLYKFEI